MEGSEFIYFLKPDPTHFYSMQDSGLAVSTTPIPLDFDPDGWQDISIQNQRNKKYWGVDRTLTIPYSFVEDGAGILKSVFYKYGVEGKAFLTICQQQLDLDFVSNAVLNFTSGSNPFTHNVNNIGTITGIPGEKMYLKLSMHSVNPAALVNATINGINYNLFSGGMPIMISVIIPPSGVFNVSFFFSDSVGTSTAQIIKVNSIGSPISTYGYWYKVLMDSEVDLSTFNHNEFKVTCTMMEGGLPKYLKSSEATTYEIPLNVPQAVNVLMDGLNLHATSNFEMQEGFDVGPDYNYLYMPFTFLLTDGTATGLTFYSQFGEAVHSVPDYTTSEKFFMSTTEDVTIHFKGVIKWTMVGGGTITAKFYLHTQSREFMISDNHDYTAGDYEIPFEFDWTINANENVFFISDAPSDNLVAHFVFHQTDIKLTYITRRDATTIKALRPSYVFAQLIDKMSEGKLSVDVAAGSLLDREFNKVFTSGDGIRGISTAVIKTSISDFFLFWSTWMNAGMMLNIKNGKVIMERKIDMVDYSTVTHLGEVSNLSVTYAADYGFNTLKIGFPDSQNQDILNGKYAWCDTQEYTLGSLRVAKELDKVCKYVVDCFSAELVRVTYTPQETTNSQQDNEVFVFHIEDNITGESYKFNRDLNPFLTGIPETESVFNAGLSPKRAFYNNAADFHSCLDLMDDKTLKFTTSGKNQLVRTSSPLVIENEDVNVGSMPPQFFKPYYLSFDTPGDIDLLDELDANPLRLFSFSFQGTLYKGLPETVGIEPSSRKTQTYKLLCSSDTDLKPLIDFYG